MNSEISGERSYFSSESCSACSEYVPDEPQDKKVNGDPTLGGIKDPALRLRKLEERKKHIDEQIRELEDKRYVIDEEIKELRK